MELGGCEKLTHVAKCDTLALELRGGQTSHKKRAMERLTPAVKLILESDCFSRIGSAVKN
jgi:hypothetical protein